MADVGYGCVMHSTLMEDNYTFIIYGRAFHIHGKAFQKSCQRMRFQRFRAVKILNGYNLSG